MRLRKIKRSPYWYADLRRYGLGFRSTGLLNKKKAEKAVIQYLAKKGAYPRQSRGNLSELIQQYLVYAGTYKTVPVLHREQVILQLFLEHVRDHPLGEIGKEEIESFKLSRMMRVGPATVNRDLSCVRRAFALAEKLGWIDQSPCLKVERLREKKLLPKPYTKEEAERLLHYSPVPWYHIWKLFLCTGMRLGEMMNLKKVDVHGNKLLIRDPKERREKLIFLPQHAISSLLGLMKLSQDEYVIWFRAKRYMQTNFYHCSKAAGLTGGIHRLRHTMISYLIDQGESLATIRDLAGHADIRTTNRYIGSVREKQSAVEKLDFGKPRETKTS